MPFARSSVGGGMEESWSTLDVREEWEGRRGDGRWWVAVVDDVAIDVAVAVAVVAGRVVAVCLSSISPGFSDPEVSLPQSATSTSEALLLPWKALCRSVWAAPGTSTSTVAMARSLPQVRQVNGPFLISAARSRLCPAAELVGGWWFDVVVVWLARAGRTEKDQMQVQLTRPLKSGMTSAATGQSP